MPSDAATSTKKDKQSLAYIARSGLAGGIAGCVAKTAVAPLDRVKILFQASNPDFIKYSGTMRGALEAGSRIYHEAGIRGLLQGHSATLLRIFPYAAIKFMAYDQVHYFLMPTKANETNLRRFSAGAISGMISVCFTYPLELIRVRMAFHSASAGDNTRPSLTRIIRQISAESATQQSKLPTSTLAFDRFPVLKFYRGFTVTIAGMIPYAGTSFLAWGYLRARFLDNAGPNSSGKARPTPLADLGIGAISGAIAQTASYPFEVVRRRMQVGGLHHPDRWLRWDETVSTIWRSQGLRGFYVGLGIGYLKIVPMTGISFAVWQSCKRLLDI